MSDFMKEIKETIDIINFYSDNFVTAKITTS